jgi:RNA polymerase sigma-70 factor (ECF subfamily)
VPKTEAELEEERLLVEAAQRDRAAFDKLYDRYFDQIYSYVYYHCGNREQAEDITAATFQRGLEDLPNFHWRGVPYSAWLYRVASRLLSRDRRRPAWLELQEDRVVEAADEPDTAWLRREESTELHDAIRGLPPDQRQAILLRFFAGMRNKEVGKVMNRSEGAVKLLVFRAVSNLREALADVPRDQAKPKPRRRRKEVKGA